MSNELNRSFAEAYAAAVMTWIETREAQAVWNVGDRFVFGPEDQVPDNSEMRVADECSFEAALELPGLGVELREAIYDEALFVAPYWVELLKPAVFGVEDRPKPPRLPKVIGEAQGRGFAEVYARGAVECIKSRITHYVDYDYHAEKFYAAPLSPRLSDDDTPITLQPWYVRKMFGDGLQLEPREAGFDEVELRRRVLDYALKGTFAADEAESIMRAKWWGYRHDDPNYPPAEETTH